MPKGSRMNYKNLRDHQDRTDMRDNDEGHFTQQCPFCKRVQLQVDARKNRCQCHNTRCPQYHKWFTVSEIDAAIRKYL